MLLGPLLLVALAVLVASFVFALSTVRPLDERPLAERAAEFAAAWRSRKESEAVPFDEPESVSIVDLLDGADTEGRNYVQVDEMVSDMGRVLPVAQVALISERIRALRPTKAASAS